MVKIAFALLVVTLSMHPFTIRGDTLTTEEIVARSQSTDCLDWKISGICIWLRCSIFGCQVVTTPRISHYLPDFVVSSYAQTGQSPWPVVEQSLFDPTTDLVSSLSGGSITGTGTSRLLQDELKFHEVDVIGSPVTRVPGVKRFLCRRASQPFFPYFLSLFDAKAWRSGSPDSSRREALTPGMREIGSWPDYTWGSIYPRSGFILQTHAGKSAAVASQRAIDVVLRDNIGHIASRMAEHTEQDVRRGNPKASNPHTCGLSGGQWQRLPRSNKGGQCVKQVWRQWLPIADEKSDRWQMLLPHHSKRCETFGRQPEWPYPEVAGNDRYIWNYWGRYKCCVKAGGTLLSHFDF